MPNKIVSVDENFDLPAVVQERQATRLLDDNTPEGQAIAEKIASKSDTVKTGDSSSSGSISINLSDGNYRVLNLTGNTKLSVSGWSPSGQTTYATFEIKSNGHAITWPSSWLWLGRTTPTLTAGSVDIISVFSRDGGSTILATPSRNYGPAVLPLLSTLLDMNPLYLLGLDETSGSFIDLSGGGHSAALVGGISRTPSLVPSDSSGQSITLDGTTGYITETLGPVTATNPSQSAFSLAFSIKASDPGAASGRVYYSGASTTTGALFSITSSSTATKRLVVQLRDDAGVFILNSNPTSIDVLDNAAHFVVFTYNNGSWTWYVDGQPRGAGTVSTPTGAFTATRWAWGVAHRATPTNFFKGSLDTLSTFTRALTPDEVFSAYVSWLGDKA